MKFQNKIYYLLKVGVCDSLLSGSLDDVLCYLRDSVMNEVSVSLTLHYSFTALPGHFDEMLEKEITFKMLKKE